jgi:hypothetical protein
MAEPPGRGASNLLWTFPRWTCSLRCPVDVDDPADADDLDTLTVMLCRRMSRVPDAREGEDGPRLRLVC